MWLALLAIYVFFLPLALRIFYVGETRRLVTEIDAWERDRDKWRKRGAIYGAIYDSPRPRFSWFWLTWLPALIWPVITAIYLIYKLIVGLSKPTIRLFRATVFAPTAEQRQAFDREAQERKYQEAVKAAEDAKAAIASLGSAANASFGKAAKVMSDADIEMIVRNLTDQQNGKPMRATYFSGGPVTPDTIEYR